MKLRKVCTSRVLAAGAVLGGIAALAALLFTKANFGQNAIPVGPAGNRGLPAPDHRAG